MAFTLSNVYRDDESQGGSIGLWIPDKEGKRRKVWWDEDDFMDMFEKGDEKTKEILMDAMKTGKPTTPEEDYESELWRWEDKGRKGEKPQAPEISTEADIPEKPVKIPPKPPVEFEESDFQMEDQASQLPVAEAPRDTAISGIMEKATPSPYERKPQLDAITPENFSEYERQNREGFRNYMRKYDWLKTITPGEAAKRKIESSEPAWFEEFAQNRGRPGMRVELMDDYKRSKDPEMREFMYDWQQFSTKNKEAIYDMTNQKFQRAKQDEREEVYRYEKDMDVQRRKMNELIRQIEKEKKEYTPEAKVKDMESLAKATDDLTLAKQEGNQVKIEALEMKIGLLNARLGRRDETRQVDEKKLSAAIERWRASGASEKEIDRRSDIYRARE